MNAPVLFQWDGECMFPIRAHQKRCDDQFVIGERYRMEVREERSIATHNHFFAAINEAWRNLPELLALQFPSPGHLRKYALIKTGYHDSNSIAAASNAEALRIAAFIKPMDEFAVVIVREATVMKFTAKSQSVRAMGKAEFQASKQKVLDFLDDLNGVPRGAHQANAGQMVVGPRGEEVRSTDREQSKPGEEAGTADREASRGEEGRSPDRNAKKHERSE